MKIAFPPVLQLKLLVTAVILITSLIVIYVEFIPLQSNSLTLPAPDLTGSLPLSAAIRQSNLTPNLHFQSLKIKEISQLLWALQGTTHSPGFRTVPSAGATYPLKIFIQQKGDNSFNNGCYSYDSDDHQLKSFSSNFKETQLFSALLSEDQSSISNVSTVFFILAEYSRTTDRYGERGIQYVHLEVGHALQNFLLQLISLNLDTWVISEFDSSQVQEFLNTSLQPLIILPVGRDPDTTHASMKLKTYTQIDTEEMTVEQAIAKRKSTRDYVSGQIPLSIIRDILYDSTSGNFLEEYESHFDLRLVVGEIEGLAGGMYSYSLINHSLTQYHEGDSRQSLRSVALDQPWVESAQLDLIISVNETWMNQQPDLSLSHRKLMYNIGMIAQNVYLKCAAHSLGTVVIGAFSEGGVAQLLEIPDSHTPFYILPIGLTPAFFEQDTVPYFPLTEIGRNVGLFSFVLFYTSLYLTLPVLKRRFRKQILWFHYISGSLLTIGIGFHFMILHGHVTSLSKFFNIHSYLSAFSNFLGNILTFPTTRYDVGQSLANLGLSFGLITAVTGLFMVFKLRGNRKRLRFLHKYSIFITLVLIIIHNLLNGTFHVIKPLMFLYLNILVFTLYYFIHYSFDLFRLSRTQVSLAK